MPGSKRPNVCSQKLQKVEKIVKELQEKHKTSYTVEQLNAWAHLLELGKHDSYETPPNLPYFRKSSDHSKKNKPQKPQPMEIRSSPSKRLGLHGDCIEQLSKWYNLLEKGAISRQQYDELKEAIMGDISKLGTID